MLFKNGVLLKLQPEMAQALPLIDYAHDDIGLDRGAVVTSANDGRHMDGSLHYEGQAVDLRTRELNQLMIGKLAAALRKRLNGAEDLNRPYQVVVEHDHLHIEWDPQ